MFMSISAISLQNLEGLQQRIEANKNATYEEQEKMVQSLFSQKFYNSGAGSKASIKLEIDRLEAYIKRLQPQVEQIYEQLRTMNTKVQKAHQELTTELAKIASESEEYTQKQYDEINKAVETASVMYMNGEITKEEMPNKIAQLIETNNPAGAARIRSMMASSESKSNEIQRLVTNLTSLFTIADNMSGELASAQASLSLMKLLYLKTDDAAGGYSNSDDDASVPVYTPKKEAMVTNWDNQYTNGNVTDLEDAINNGYLQQMKDQGFTFKEAMYATEFIFGKSGISYELGNTATVPNGGVYDTFCQQVKDLWGKDCNRLEDGSTVDPETGEIIPPAPPATNNTDPIGWVNENTTFDFAVDRNKDNIFNGKEEFLGAEQGIDELFALDLDKDGKINGEELNNLLIVRNNHEIGDFGFISAQMAGLSEIDLNSFQQTNYVNVNGNTEAGKFNLTVDGRTTQGRQTLDNENYLNTAYGKGYGRQYTISLSEAETKDIYAELSNNKNPLSKEDINVAKANQKESELNLVETDGSIKQNEVEVSEAKTKAQNTQVETKQENEEEQKKKTKEEEI